VLRIESGVRALRRFERTKSQGVADQQYQGDGHLRHDERRAQAALRRSTGRQVVFQHGAEIDA
jgi:hypothetical protein